METDLKRRIEVLRKKVKAENLTFPNEVLLYIATHIKGSRKELEGALIRVVSYSVLFNRDIDLDMATEALRDRIMKSKPKRVSAYLSGGAAVAAVSGMLLVGGCSVSNVLSLVPVAAAAQQQDVSLNGNAESFQQVSIFPPAAGSIKSLLVTFGSYVEKGQKLADLDEGALAYQIQQAQAQVQQNQVEAHMKSTQQKMSSTQANNTSAASAADLKTAQAKVKDLDLALSQAQQNWTRIQTDQAKPPELVQAEQLNNQLQQQLSAAKQEQNTVQTKVNSAQQMLQQQSGKSVDPSLLSDWNTANAKVTQLENALAEAQNNWSQLKNQIDQRVSNKAQLDQAAAAKDQADIQLSEAKQMVDALTAKATQDQQTTADISSLQQQLDQDTASLAQMSLQQAQANLQNLQNQADNLQMLAPISGFITESTGSTDSSGGAASKTSPLFVIANLDQVYVKMDAPEAMIGKINLDQQATVTFATIGKTYQGKVTYIGEMADLNTMTYPVRILIDNKDHLIRGGMRAQVTLKQ